MNRILAQARRAVAAIQCAWNAYWLRGDIQYLDKVIDAYEQAGVEQLVITALLKQRAAATVRLILNETGEPA